MTLKILLSLFCLALSASAQMPKGIDVSGHTTGVNFESVKANGVSFVYIKATEGTGAYFIPADSYENP